MHLEQGATLVCERLTQRLDEVLASVVQDRHMQPEEGTVGVTAHLGDAHVIGVEESPQSAACHCEQALRLGLEGHDDHGAGRRAVQEESQMQRPRLLCPDLQYVDLHRCILSVEQAVPPPAPAPPLQLQTPEANGCVVQRAHVFQIQMEQEALPVHGTAASLVHDDLEEDALDVRAAVGAAETIESELTVCEVPDVCVGHRSHAFVFVVGGLIHHAHVSGKTWSGPGTFAVSSGACG
jgi:hypothetical protein